MAFLRQSVARPLFLAVVIAMVSESSFAFGSGGGHEPSFADLTFPWINFVMYAALLTYLLRNPIKKGWSARVGAIKDRIEGASEQLEIAERELNAAEALVQGVEQEKTRIKTEVSVQASREADLLVEQAKERAERLKQQAAEMLEGEMRSAQSAFKADLVARAVSVAKQKFSSGEYASRESVYAETAMAKAKQLVQ